MNTIKNNTINYCLERGAYFASRTLYDLLLQWFRQHGFWLAKAASRFPLEYKISARSQRQVLRAGSIKIPLEPQ